MSGLLGESGAHAIFYHLGIDKVRGDAGAFHRGLTSLLGGPADVIETMIVKSLYARLGLPFSEAGGPDFVRRVDEARAKLSAKSGGGGQG